MEIHGLQKLTLLDFPGHTACTVFTGRCNFRCPFCQNASLVLRPESLAAIPEADVFAFLEKRKGLLDGVAVTGGEPTLQPDLADFLRRVKDLGFAVKLDTNGARPDVLRGQLAQLPAEYVRGGRKPAEGIVLGNTLLNVAARPQFIAYRIGPKPACVRFAEALGAMAVGWTSHSRDSEAGRDAVIFEYYKPNVRYK